MKWTPEKDQIYLLKLIETHQIRVDYNKLAAAWPKDTNDNPTPKALSEHMGKLRKMTGMTSTPASASATPSRAASTTFKTPASGSKTSTPTKNGTENRSISNNPSRKKRARIVSGSDEDEDLSIGMTNKPTLVRGVSKLVLNPEEAETKNLDLPSHDTAFRMKTKGNGKENEAVASRNRPSRVAAAKCQETLKKAKEMDGGMESEEDSAGSAYEGDGEVEVDEGFGDGDEEEEYAI